MAVADRETIELLVESPVVRHPGLEEAIRLLERVDVLTGRKHRLHIDVTGNISELDALARVADMYKALRAETKATNAAAKTQQISLAQVGEKMQALHMLAAQLADVEARLVRPVNAATAALDNQTDIAKRKAVAMGQLARVTGKVADAERGRRGDAEKGAGAAAPGGRGGVLSSTRTAEGILKGRTFSEGVGVTRREAYTRAGTVVTVEESRIARAQAELKGLLATGKQQADVLKAQGAPAAALAGHYRDVANSVDALHGKYRDIAPALKADAVGQQMRMNAAKVEAAATRKAAEERERVYSRAETADRRKATMQARTLRERAQAAKIAEDFDLTGFSQDPASRKVKQTPRGRQESMTFSREAGGLKETAQVMMEYDRAGNLLTASSQRTAKAIKEVDANARLAGQGFLANAGMMAQWAASGALLYGSLALIRKGFESFTDIERRTAILQQVFRGSAEDAARLRDEVLQLASANGRSSVEAVDAATRFSRLGLTRVEVLEATAVALKAANVAEIDTATAAEQLSAVYASYSLRVEDLNTVLNQLNTISNTYNVTNKDLLNGLARTASLGKQAGIGLTELMGIIGAGAGRTGRPGAEFGNAIKSIIVALSNPKLQGVLKTSFDIDVKDSSGEIKNFSEILRELFLRYQELNNAERQALVTRVANKQQASRLTALLDGYVQSQVLAIRANTDLTSAERENARVRATLSAQIQGLITQYEALSAALAGSNSGTGFNTTLTTLVEFLRNLLALMTQSSDIVAIVIAVMGLLAVRVGLVAIKMAAASKEQNFFRSTCAGTTQALTTLRAALGSVVMGYNAVGMAATKAGVAQRTSMAGGAVRPGVRPAAGARGGGVGGFFKDVLGGTLIGAAIGSVVPGAGTAAGAGGGALRGLVGGLARLAATIAIDIAAFKGIEAAIYGVNRAFEASATSAEKTNRALAGLDQKLEETKAKAEALRLGGRLAGTLEKLVLNPRQDPRFVEEQLRIGAEGLTDNQAERERLAQLYREGRLSEVIAKLKEYGRNQEVRGLETQREAIVLTDRLVQNTKLAVALREQALRNKGKDLAQDDVLQTLRRNLAELEGRRLTLQVDLEVDDAGINASSEKVAELMKERIEQRLALLGGVYGNLGSTEGQKANLSTAGLQAQQMLLQKVLSRSEAESASSVKAAEEKTAREEAALRGSDRFQVMMDRAQRDVANAESRLAREKSFASGNAFDSGDAVARAQVGLEEARRKLKDLETLSPTAVADGELFANLQKSRAEQQQIVQSAEAHLQAVRETVAAQQEQLDKEMRIAEAKRQIVQYQEAIARGAREAGLVGASAGGATETQRLLNEARRLSGPVAARESITGTPLSGRAAVDDLDRARATGDVKGELQAIANIQAQAARAEEIQFALLQRKLALENEITLARQRQNEEVSRAVLMGSREEQLRAAAAARFSQQRGGRAFSAEEFMFLDQTTRQGVQRTNPNLLPPEMHTELQQLTAEYQASRNGLLQFNGALGDSIKAVIEFAERLKPSEGAQDEINKKTQDALGGIDPAALQQTIRDAGAGVAAEVGRLSETYVGALNDVRSSLTAAISDVDTKVNRLTVARPGLGSAQRTG